MGPMRDTVGCLTSLKPTEFLQEGEEGGGDERREKKHWEMGLMRHKSGYLTSKDKSFHTLDTRLTLRKGAGNWV